MQSEPSPTTAVQNAIAGSQKVHGSAEWMDEACLRALHLDEPFGVVLGRRDNGELIHFNGDGHILVFSPTGGGKGIGFVQPNLADYRGSVVCLDPKGENAITSSEARLAMGQDVLVLDPFGITYRASENYNPLGALTFADDLNLGPRIESLADAKLATNSFRQFFLGQVLG